MKPNTTLQEYMDNHPIDDKTTNFCKSLLQKFSYSDAVKVLWLLYERDVKWITLLSNPEQNNEIWEISDIEKSKYLIEQALEELERLNTENNQ